MLKRLLEEVNGYKVLLVGDGIIDEYVYVTPQGKSPKENIITYLYQRSEQFRGGAWAAARHVEGYGGKVSVSTGPFATKKTRFVDGAGLKKEFEIHEPVKLESWSAIAGYEDYDMVIVTDFGHGWITPRMIQEISDTARFLAVNAQTNSANHGFNLITKYPRSDYVVLDELEARLAAHDRDGPLEDVIERLGFQRMIVTLGNRGCIGYDHGEFTRAPSISTKVLDTMGAGDAFFCVTAPLAAAGADMATLCKVGNAAGAIKCSVVGHRQSVTKQALLEALTCSA